MKTEFLKAMGLTDEQVADIMKENGKDVEASKAKFSDYDDIKTQLAEAGKTIDGFKAALEAVKKDNGYLFDDTPTPPPYASGTGTKQMTGKSAESKTHFKCAPSDGDIITFDEPTHNLSASGLTIKVAGVNYAVVGAGNGTLTYIHATREVEKIVANACGDEFPLRQQSAAAHGRNHGKMAFQRLL